MLVLDRREGERIVIDGGIVITIAAINGSARRVKVGIDAPRDVRVLREEIAVAKRPRRK